MPGSSAGARPAAGSRLSEARQAGRRNGARRGVDPRAVRLRGPGVRRCPPNPAPAARGTSGGQAWACWWRRLRSAARSRRYGACHYPRKPDRLEGKLPDHDGGRRGDAAVRYGGAGGIAPTSSAPRLGTERGKAANGLVWFEILSMASTWRPWRSSASGCGSACSRAAHRRASRWFRRCSGLSST